MQGTAIIFQSVKFKLSEKENESFIPGRELAIFLIHKLIDKGFRLVHGPENNDTNFVESALEETCYYYFKLRDKVDILEFFVSLVRLGSPLQEYWSVQFNKMKPYRKFIFRLHTSCCVSSEMANIIEEVIIEIGDINNLQKLTDEQYSALLIAQ